MAREMSMETLLALGDSRPVAPGKPVSPPIYQSTIFAAASSADLGEAFRAGSDRFYARLGNPTVDRLGRLFAEVEVAEAAAMFPSGMSAIATTVLALCNRGSHAIVHESVYGQTVTLFQWLRDAFGLAVTFVDAREPANVRNALRPDTSFVLIETPSNPRLQLIDIAATAAVLDGHASILVVDATFASPALQHSIPSGADLVIHSCTKFIAGHSDVMGGVVAGSAELVERIVKLRGSFGGVLDPHAAWLIQRGMRTLHVRLAKQSESALAIARALQEHPAVHQVRYPFLEEDPGHAVARRQMSAGSGMVAFWMHGGLANGRSFLDRLELISITTSLGGVESVVEVPAELDYSMDGSGGATRADRDEPCLVRLSVGLESVDDLLADIHYALDTMG